MASKGFSYPSGGFCFFEGNSMSTESFKRRLSAILGAVVAGYSRLTGEDEATTAMILKTHSEQNLGFSAGSIFAYFVAYC